MNPSVPSLYVIPDVHGCIKTLRFVIENQIKPNITDELYFLGDYINKGPDSKGVLDYIFELKARGYRIFPIKGNHEQLLLDAFLGDDYNNFFIDRGGIQVLESFGVDHVRNIPSGYIHFFKELPYFIERDNYLFVHAGFDFSKTNPFENLEAMLVIRDFYTEPNRLDHKTIIHGHNPIPYPDIKYILDNSNLKYIPLDAGCVYVDRPGLGNLCIIRLNDLKIWVQPCIDYFSI